MPGSTSYGHWLGEEGAGNTRGCRPVRKIETLTNGSDKSIYRAKNRELSVPGQKNYEYAYGLAYKLASERLAGIDDIEQQCRGADAQCCVINSVKVVTIEYLNRSYLISLPEGNISLMDSEEEVPLREKVMILHYLILAKGTPLTNKLITFKELPAGVVYSPTFDKRTIKPILKYFGEEPQRLVMAAEKLGGNSVDYGDVAVTISAFKRVPITIALWRGDDEFAPEGNVLFDAAISDYLSTEDTTVLCEMITWKLINYLREAAKSNT
ncbi:DUF3786 domain-containing protein [Chloroflexota bacterium]